MKLSRLYSDDPRFKNIIFKDGLNVIYGYVTNRDSNDPHNLGKTALVHLIDFKRILRLEQRKQIPTL